MYYIEVRHIQTKERLFLKHDIIIVGGGASGIIAAITAKNLGKDVAIIEGNDRIGKKILTTGNGRCNITNKCIDFSNYHSKNIDFFNFALSNFNATQCEDFFYSLGLPLVTLEDGKMYPMSLQASSVLDILKKALEEHDIPVYLNTKVKTVKQSKLGFRLPSSEENLFECKNLILATGGKSAPKTGSDGSGYTIAKAFGHSIVNPIPSLVQLKLNYKNLKAISGIKFDGFAEIIIDDQVKRKEFGEILFTDYGISGPPILQLSSVASRAISIGKKATLRIDLMPSKSMSDIVDFFENHWGTFNYRSVFDSFIGIINKKLIPIILKEAGVTEIHKPCFELTWKEKKNIFSFLKTWFFEIIDTNSFSNSQVTAGGVDTTFVNNLTMESKLISNLFFSGELLDVDGDCGGFNLQWAWSSGYLAGYSASRKL